MSEPRRLKGMTIQKRKPKNPLFVAYSDVIRDTKARTEAERKLVRNLMKRKLLKEI